jgi:uncharacterized DUF497 family protein
MTGFDWDPRKGDLNRRKHAGGEMIRIISARHALRHERTRYEQQAH